MKIRDIASVSESATDTDGDNNNDVALNVYTRSARTPSLSETDVALRSKLHGMFSWREDSQVVTQ